MNDIILNSKPQLTQEFSFSFFDSFVKYVDRTEQTTRTYITNLRQFAAWLLYMDIRKPGRQDVINYRDYLGQEHEAIKLCGNSWEYRTDKNGNRVKLACRISTIRAYLQSISQFFKWTEQEGLYPNIALNIHFTRQKALASFTEDHKKEALSAAEVLKVEESILQRADQKKKEAATHKKDPAGRLERATEQGKRLYAMYLLAVNCGLRTVELSRANIKDLESKGGNNFLYVWGKGCAEASQKKAITKEVKEAIDDYLQSRSDAWNSNSPLFVSTGNRSKGKRIASTTISTMLKRALQGAGFNSEKITAHSLRHTAGTCVQELTNDLYTTQKYMRHANPKTTEIYLHTNEQKKEVEVADKLYKYYHEKDHQEKEGSSLFSVVANFSQEQLEQLTQIAISMT